MRQAYTQGFTLVETLVALAVFALLAMAGAAMLGQSIDNEAQLADANARIQSMQQARAILRADFGQALDDRPVRYGDGATRPGFSVGQDGALLTLVRLNGIGGGGDARAAVIRVSYVLEPGRGLVRRQYGPADGSAAPLERVLFRNAQSVAVQLYWADAWQDAAQWTPSVGLPAAVDLQLVDARGVVTQLKFLTPAATNRHLAPATADMVG